MVQWQFLIQKDGDQEWLPLEVPHVEILEGRYRLAAQAEMPMQQVVIQIHHEYDIDGIPQQTTQRRCQHTDIQGQLALLPLSFVAPGLWEFTCFSTDEANQPSSSPVHNLTLQVLAQDEGLMNDWEPFDVSPVNALPIDSLSGLPLLEAYTLPQSPTIIPPIKAEAIPQHSAAKVSPQAAKPAITVSLPRIPKDCPEIPLHVSLGFQMPPQLYIAPEGVCSDKNSPQLPEFLPMSIGLYRSISMPASAFALEGLQQIAATVDPQVTQTAFDALVQRQRFWENLNALALTP